MKGVKSVKKKLSLLLCIAVTLCAMSSTVLAVSAEPIKEADPVTAMITAADTLPGISAYPAEVRASEENGVYRLEKVYYLTAKDDPATIPTADFEREGRTYTLLDLLKNDQTETDTREHIEVVTLESKTKDMEEILKMLEPKLEVKTEDGYEGVLSLDHTTIQVEAAGYGTSSRTVTAERTYPNLSDADVSLVPKSVNENGRTLTLADVSWQEAAVDPTDGYDIPIRYTAVASYTLNAGELLTPNLVSGSATGTVSGTGGVTVLPPSTSGSTAGGNTGSYTPVKYTAVTKDLYYSGGYLGTLKIPTLGLSVKVYQGTDADALRKGAGHFASASIWEGNVAIAGHNRGVNNHFGKIHTLDIGDTIKLTTQLGTRSYEVYSVSKISVDDTSVLNDSTENIITLVTCVNNQPDYRWCVQARQK